MMMIMMIVMMMPMMNMMIGRHPVYSKEVGRTRKPERFSVQESRAEKVAFANEKRLMMQTTCDHRVKLPMAL
jgi:hypothetical protein